MGKVPGERVLHDAHLRIPSLRRRLALLEHRTRHGVVAVCPNHKFPRGAWGVQVRGFAVSRLPRLSTRRASRHDAPFVPWSYPSSRDLVPYLRLAAVALAIAMPFAV